MIKVLISHSLHLLRAGLRSTISSCLDMEIVDEINTVPALLKEVEITRASILVTDLLMSHCEADIKGIDMLQRLNNISNKLPVLVLINEHYPEYALHLFQAGCSGCITLSAQPDNLSTAIRTVSSGEFYTCENLKQELMPFIINANDIHFQNHLSTREYQVLKGIAGGQLSKREC